MNAHITAVIPTHDRAGLLATTLRTVLWQRDVSLEVIVVDDGSTDETPTTVKQLRDPRVRFLRNERPEGVSAARNRGAAEARTSWLAFCDDDDLWAPDKLARQLAAAQTVGSAWAYGGAVHVNIHLAVLSAMRPPAPARLVSILPGWNLMPGGSSNVIVRTDTFRAVGGWDPGLVNLADWDLWARLAREGHPACVDGPLVGYRIHPGNASRDTGLILREARILDGRYGAKVDYGELHHYLSWVHLRSGHRRPAARHLALAAARGQALAVTRVLAHIARRRMARLAVLRAKRPLEADDWIAEAETWVTPLRDADLATA
jgi:glycosyltransferase involved in cell wall biosynthesis